MTTRCAIRNMTRTTSLTLVGFLLTTGCATKPADDSTSAAAAPVQVPARSAQPERPSMTTAECEAKGGRVVGDIGDGATHRPDYTCEGGPRPLADIRPAEGEPIATEGSVCCPTAS